MIFNPEEAEKLQNKLYAQLFISHTFTWALCPFQTGHVALAFSEIIYWNHLLKCSRFQTCTNLMAIYHVSLLF